MKNIGMKNIGMKKNINEQREGIWGESLKSLKSLKSLMQIFAESVESANSAKQIFATFATFAMQIFSNLVNMVKMVKTVMQIFAKGEYSAVRVSSVQQPTNIQRISNLSPTVSTVKVAQRSRITPFLPLLATVVMLSLGVGNAWGAERDIYGRTAVIDGIGGTAKVETKWGNNKDLKDASTTNELVSAGSTESHWGNFLDPWPDFCVVFTAIPDEGYYFDGWYPKEDGTGEKVSDNPYTTDKNKGPIDVTYCAKFNPNPYTIAYNNHGGSGAMTSTDATYNTEVTLRLNTFTNSSSSSYTVTYNTNGGTCAVASEAAGYTFRDWNTAENGSGRTFTDGQSVSNLTSTKDATVTLYAQWRETVTLPSATKAGYELDGWYNGSIDDQANRVGGAGELYYPTSTVTLNAKWVDKLDPTITGADNATLKVGEEQADAFYLYQVDGPVATIDVVSISPINDGSGKVIEYDAVKNKIIARNAGTATIYFYQAETSSVKEKTSAQYTYTVSKHSNTISSSTGNWSNSINFEKEIELSSNNSTAPLVVTRTSGDANVTTYDAVNKKIVANFREGTVTWSVSQAEDYKYEAAIAQTLSVTVGTLPSPDCYVAVDTWNSAGEGHDFGSSWELNWDEEGVADSVVFTIRRSWGDTDAKCDIYATYSDGTDPFKIDRIAGSWDDSYKTFGRKIPNPQATGIRFKGENGVNSRYVKNVYVYRKKWFKIKNAAGDAEITELTMPSRTLVGDSTEATFKVDYSTCADYIKVVSDNPHIVVKADDRQFSSTTNGERTITLKYSSDVAEDIAATVTIYTPYEHKTLTVNAETVSKLSTELRWKEGVSTTYSVDHANMAATDLFEVYDANNDKVANPTIKLTSSDSTKIDIVHVDGKDYVDFLCGGDVTITALYAGDATYAAASDLGQSITVNKVADEITWGAAVVNDTLRVYADQDIAYSLATAHTSATKPITYTSGDAAILRVTPGVSSDALHTLKYDTVSLTATTTTDCFYSSVSSSIVVVVLPCKHRIVWNQTFGYHTEADGTIDKNIVLNAYAVDSTGAKTNVAISYTMPSVGFARIDEGVLEIDDIGETTITARTATDNKYATAEVERSVIARISGENVAYAYNNGDDVSDGKIVINGRHATFTIAGPTGIYYYTGGSCGDDGYFLASLDKNTNATYTLSWSCDPSCTIEVTNISFWGKAYNWAAGRASKARIIFNGKNVPVGTAALTCNSADYAKFSESGSFSSPMTIECQNTHGGGISPNDFDFYLKNIVIQYTITAKTPTGGSETALAATLSPDDNDKQTAALGSLFSMANPASDFAYEYQLKEDYTNAFIEGGNFYATYGGDYEVQSRVAPDGDHKASEWSTSTIHVTRTCIFNNSSTDKDWETVSNWEHNVQPAAIDAVSVQGNLIVDKEIEVMSMSIEGEAVVHIAPNGGLTVGAGGITGATKEKLILKAGTTGETKGQTGYLRISPEYTGAMPEATVEMLRQAYSNGAVTTGSFKMTGTSTWQYVGCPVEKEGILLKKIIGGWINSWDEESGAWINNRATLETKPFVGVANSQSIDPSGAINAFKGQLINVKTEHEIPLTYHGDSPMAGWNLLANSFAAPIDIKKMLDDNAGADIEQTVYLFNTGNTSDVSGESGTYTVVTKALAGTTEADVEYQGVIPAMQGFFVKANSNCNFTFNYTNAVWNATYAAGSENTPMRVNRRNDSSDKQVLSISMEANGQRDKVLLIEQEDYSTEFENGYDAHYMPVGGFNVFAVEGDDHLAVDATNSLIGTRVGVRTGEETAYTLVFSHVNSEEDMMLWDTEAEEKVEIREGGMYTFFAEPNSEITGRFIIVEAEAPEIATGISNDGLMNDEMVKAKKFVKDDQLYILKNGVLYDATGMRVR